MKFIGGARGMLCINTNIRITHARIIIVITIDIYGFSCVVVN